MIPLLGVLCLNRGDLLLRMMSSIDYPIDKLAIVQNGCEPDVVEAINIIQNTKNPLINAVYLERPFRNTGVAPAWNSIIKSFPEVEFWLIANNDTVFLPGDLEKYHTTWSANKGDVIVSASSSFDCFIISPHIVSLVGLFDENIWPIYSEDLDYFIRMKRATINRIPIPSDVGYSNNGSWTIKSSAKYKANNNYTQESNRLYVENKWGPEQEYMCPWDDDEYRSIKDWQYDPVRRLQHSKIWNHFEETANKKVINE